MKLFNASGHAIKQDGVEVVGEVAVPNLDPTKPEEIEAAAERIADAAKHHASLGTPVALPGMSILAAHVLAELHGLIGSWPVVAWSCRVDGKFVWSEDWTNDLQDFRLYARGER